MLTLFASWQVLENQSREMMSEFAFRKVNCLSKTLKKWCLLCEKKKKRKKERDKKKKIVTW